MNMKLNVFGKHIEVLRRNNRWETYYLGNEGKKRIAEDILVPSNIDEADLVEYIADLCHEWATPQKNNVFIIK